MAGQPDYHCEVLQSVPHLRVRPINGKMSNVDVYLCICTVKPLGKKNHGMNEKPQWGSPAAQGVKCNTAGVLLFFAGAILVGI